MRLTVDYRKLNEVIEPDAFPIPRIDETLERLAGAKLASGYWQMPVAKEDVEKTAFTTPWGLFETPVLPMGLKKKCTTSISENDDKHI